MTIQCPLTLLMSSVNVLLFFHTQESTLTHLFLPSCLVVPKCSYKTYDIYFHTEFFNNILFYNTTTNINLKQRHNLTVYLLL